MCTVLSACWESASWFIDSRLLAVLTGWRASFIRELIPVVTPFSWPSHLPEASSPDTITLEIMNFGGTQIFHPLQYTSQHIWKYLAQCLAHRWCWVNVSIYSRFPFLEVSYTLEFLSSGYWVFITIIAVPSQSGSSGWVLRVYYECVYVCVCVLEERKVTRRPEDEISKFGKTGSFPSINTCLHFHCHSSNSSCPLFPRLFQ